jgi:hypothetical protein
MTESDGYARETRFTGILDAIAVQVFPGKVPDGPQSIDACIPGGIILARDQSGGGGLPGVGVGVAVDGVVATNILWAEVIAIRRVEHQVVVSRGQTGEGVRAAQGGRVGDMGPCA